MRLFPLFCSGTRDSCVQTCMGPRMDQSSNRTSSPSNPSPALSPPTPTPPPPPPPPVMMFPDDLKLNLECPVCSKISLPPIMQCRNGHVTCNICRGKVQSCPMCREIDINIRYTRRKTAGSSRYNFPPRLYPILIYIIGICLPSERLPI